MAVQKHHLPPMQTDGEPWLPRDVLPEGLHVRLLAYEKACRKSHCLLKFIVNLCRNQSFMKGRSEFVPTLLTHTSALWSMRVGRCASMCLRHASLVPPASPSLGVPLRLPRASLMPPYGIASVRHSCTRVGAMCT